MNRPLLILCLLALSACGAAVTMPAYVAAPNDNDYMDREKCLYSQVCIEIGKRGTAPLDLEQSANTAAFVCQAPIANKIRSHLVSTEIHIDWQDVINQENIRLLEVEQHALAVAQESKDECRVGR